MMAGMLPTLGVSQVGYTCVCRGGVNGKAGLIGVSFKGPGLMEDKVRLRIKAVQEKVEECNEEECAPAKEVGSLSMGWKAEESTKVAETFPPISKQERKWTGYVEKDTAGQTNIYAVEPTVYLAENAFSSGTAGNSAEGTGKNLAVAFGLGLIALASASSILFTVGKKAPALVGETTYSGPPLSYYVKKFTPAVGVEASVPDSSELISQAEEIP